MTTVSNPPEIKYFNRMTGQNEIEKVYGDLNKAINPLTYLNNDNNNLYGFAHMFGIQFKVFVVS